MIPCIHGKVPAEGIALFGKWPRKETQHKSHYYTVLHLKDIANAALVTAPNRLWESRTANSKKGWAHVKFSAQLQSSPLKNYTLSSLWERRSLLLSSLQYFFGLCWWGYSTFCWEMSNGRQLQSLPVVSVCTHVLSKPPCLSAFPSLTNTRIRLVVTQSAPARVWVLMTHSTQYCWFSTSAHLSHTHYKHQEKDQQFCSGCLHWFPELSMLLLSHTASICR